MAKTDNLEDFLADIAEAIRIRKGYIPRVFNTFEEIDALVYQKTGRHLDHTSSDSYIWYTMQNWLGSQFIMMTIEDSNGDQFMIVFFGRNSSSTSVNQDVYLSDLSLTLNESNQIIYTNVSVDVTFYTFRYKITDDLWSYWNPKTLVTCNPGSWGNLTTSSTFNAARIVVDPFVNATDGSIPAQNFASEILSI